MDDDQANAYAGLGQVPGSTSGMERTPAFHRAHLRPGRPYAVLVRLSVEEKQLVDAAAHRACLTPTGYVAQAALAAACDDTAEGNRGTASTSAAGRLREVQRELFAVRRAVTTTAAALRQIAAVDRTPAVADPRMALPEYVEQAVRLCATTVAAVDAVVRRVDRRLR